MNYHVLTPIPLILKALIDAIKAEFPNWSFQFDPSLTYTEAIKGIRAVRSSMKLSQQKAMPLFTYNTMPLVQSETLPRKKYPFTKLWPIQPGYTPDYKSRNCQMEIPWKLYTKDAVDMNTFQTLFATEATFNYSVQKVSVNLPELDPFTYQVFWQPLEANNFNKEDNVFQEVSSSLKIHGEFVVAKDVPLALIQHINLMIKSFSGDTMETLHVDQVTPTSPIIHTITTP